MSGKPRLMGKRAETPGNQAADLSGDVTLRALSRGERRLKALVSRLL
jgi:hypothetical protein